MTSFYATTPIYYANSLPHVGHLYTTVVVDCVVRARRQRGAATYFLTGTDEHGTNVQRVAARTGKTPREYVDYIVGELQQMCSPPPPAAARAGSTTSSRARPSCLIAPRSRCSGLCARAKTPKGRE